MKKRDKIIIPFEGLKDGIHEFDFSIGDTFFQNFENSLIEKGEFEIKIEFEKKPSFFQFDLTYKGHIETICDRCLDDLKLNMKGNVAYIVKVTEKLNDEEDDIIYLSPNEQELDLTHLVYENIHLALPIKKAHKSKKDCNPEVIKKLEEINITEEKNEEHDPRWDALKNLNK